ncbi:hypothetical protein AVEN_157078-1 [Araneus ventricosus]|uniref:Uncharacterized protein n=1 Tax=Araneus ventricosus TaxID=182803 RepID=A0A4Y2GN00_ARAVE|nr:hypothetical protein AVEN_157078-1 [Araneus ventricosus]
MYSIPSICPNTVFFPSIEVEKSGRSIHLKFQSALAVGESDLLYSSAAALHSPYSSPHSADSDLLHSWQDPDLVKSFEVPTTLAEDPAKDSAHELPEFGLVGNPTFPSRYAIFHRFSILSLVFSLPCTKISIFGRDMNGLLKTWSNGDERVWKRIQ